MFVFGNDSKIRGCFSAFNLFTSGGKGAYLVLPSGDTMPPNVTLRSSIGDDPSRSDPSISQNASPPIIVTGLSFAQKEKYHLVQCFSDHTYTYAFGHDPLSSLLTIDCVGFLVNDDGTDWSNIIDTYANAYKAARLVESLQVGKVFVGSGAPLTGFIVGMQTQTADAHHQLQNFSMTLLLVEAQGS